MERKGLELLAPAGSFESLIAAVQAGADAVYMGGSRFGARAYAENPEGNLLLEAIDYAHLYGVKFYLTVNTLLKDAELEKELYEYLLPCYERGADAVIVQDFGVLKAVQEWLPDLPVHASTQMTLTGEGGVNLLQKAGVSRAVLARELSLEEIAEIHKSSSIELECFVHGALCYCYSGQCLFSSMLGGRSGNRGRCAQPCRLAYEAVKEGKVLSKKGQNALLSPKDLCAIELLPQIAQAGVYSLKLEGRMKRPEYVAGVVRIYRKYIDRYLQLGAGKYSVEEQDKRELLLLFNRDGFSRGYYEQHNGRNMMALQGRSASGQEKREYESLIKELRNRYVESERKLPIFGMFYGKAGEPMSLTARMGECRVTAEGSCPQAAQNRPMGREQVEKQLQRTGNTPFVWEELQVQAEGALFIPNQELNGLRRDALDKLRDEILERYRRKAERKAPFEHREEKDFEEEKGWEKVLHISVETEEQLDAVLACVEKLKQKSMAPLFAVCLDAECLEERLPELLKRVHEEGLAGYVTLPAIFRKDTAERYEKRRLFWRTLEIDGYMIRNLEEYVFLRENGLAGRGKWAAFLADTVTGETKPEKEQNIPETMIFDHNIYTWNRRSRRLWREEGIGLLTNPLELNSRELGEISGRDSVQIIYGRYPMMVTAGCLHGTLNQCRKKPEQWMLRDRYKKEFPVKNYCRDCYNVIYNSQPFCLFDRPEELKRLNAGAWRLMFTTEGYEETRSVISAWLTNSRLAGDITRGHWKRGVE